jgi:hypothetical protein
MTNDGNPETAAELACIADFIDHSDAAPLRG